MSYLSHNLTKKLNFKWYLILLLVVFLPLQTKIVLFQPVSWLGGNFLFYNTVFVFVSDLLIILMIIMWLGNSVKHNSQYEFHVKNPAYSMFYELLLIFIFISVISVLVSHQTFGNLQIYGLFKLFLVSFLFCFTLNFFSVKHVKQLLRVIFWLILAIAVFEASLGTGQYFLQHSLGFWYLGEESLTPAVKGVAKFVMPLGQRWIGDIVFGVSHETFVMRAYGTFPHPNVFGSFMMFSLILSFWLYAYCKTPWEIVFLRVAIPVIIFGLMISFSRLAITTALLGCLVWLFSVSYATKKSGNEIFGEKVRIQKIIKELVIIVSVSFLFAGLLFAPQFLERGAIASQGTTNAESLTERALYQKIAMNMIVTRPFFGVGYQNFVLEMNKFTPQYLKSSQYQPVHNIYLLIAAETGVVGLLIFLSFIFLVLKSSWNRGAETINITLTVVFISFLFLGLLDHYVWTIQQGRLMLFLTAGWLVASATSNPDSLEAKENSPMR